MLDTVWYDIRYAVRVLRRMPRNTAVAIGILAIAIGANTAMFSAVNHVFLRPFPFADADRLVRVRDQTTLGGDRHAFNMSARHVLGLGANTSVFESIVAFSGDSMTLTTADLPERVSVVHENDNGSNTLGVQPILGRMFTRAEQESRAPDVVLISHATWHTIFGGSRAAVGRTVKLDGRPFTIVGVMPPAYAFPYDAQFWVPLALDAADGEHDFAVFARVRPGVTRRQVTDALATAAVAIARESPATSAGYGLELMTIRENLIGTQAAPLRALTNVVVFLLMVACVNVAALLLGRAAARRREMAIRSALGATRARHIRQLLTESLVLAAAGCAVGLLLTAWIAPVTAALIPTVLSGQLGLVTPTVDWRVFLFAVAVSTFSAIVAGIVPAFGSWRAAPAAALAAGGRTQTAGVGQRRLLAALIVGETALTIVLLGGAGLVIRQFINLETARLGFEPRGLLAAEIDLPDVRYPPGDRRADVVSRIVDRVRTMPGVQMAGVTTVNPLGGGTWSSPITSEDWAARDRDAAINVNYRLVTPGLFEAMGIPIVQGRTIAPQDRADTVPIAIVSRRLARRLWPDADPIGRRLRIARPGTPWITVVGVAGDVDDAHDPGVPLETWYLPYAQHAASAAAGHLYVMARSSGDVLSLIAPIRRAVADVDGTLAVYGSTPMDRYYSASLAREQTGALFMSGFGAFAVALAALGVYGVMAFSVAQRTTEIGIRMALGAAAADILPLVLGRTARLVAIGAAAGLAGAAMLNRALASVLTAVGTLDLPVILAACAAVVLAAGVAACIPAVAAARLDPARALRDFPQ